ncbi:MAG: nucleotidyltransferase family protein [Gordonibacter sp.]|nr:nucleotidyltransferase family protein [Gordonibacter sp.]
MSELTWDATLFRTAGFYVVHLISCALHGGSARNLPDGITWAHVHEIAVMNGVEGAVWVGARQLSDIPTVLRKRWSEQASMIFLRRLRFDAEREEVLAAMREQGLSYLPLKGIVIAEYYPCPEMRLMADNDILYGLVEKSPQGGFRIKGDSQVAREASVRKVLFVMRDIMEKRGYRTESFEKGNHDSFHKEPCFNFEMHRRLVPASSPYASYYENPWLRAVCNTESSCSSVDGDVKSCLEFHFADEDEYLYFLVHGFKHFDACGCGIRFLVDQQVFLRAKGEALDWNYVRTELRTLGLESFERHTRVLSETAFGKKDALGSGQFAPDQEKVAPDREQFTPDQIQFTPDQEKLLFYFLESGTYGNLRIRVEKKITKNLIESKGDLKAAKRRYLLSRVFLKEDAMQEAFPIFYRLPILRPFLPMFRVCRGLVRNPSRIRQELRVLRRVRK